MATWVCICSLLLGISRGSTTSLWVFWCIQSSGIARGGGGGGGGGGHMSPGTGIRGHQNRPKIIVNANRRLLSLAVSNRHLHILFNRHYNKPMAVSCIVVQIARNITDSQWQ